MLGVMPLLAALVIGAPEANATEIGYGADFGLGLTLGSPTGVSGKYYFDGPMHAVDASIATQLFGPGADRASIYATYLYHPGVLLSGSVAQLPWHVGVGPQLWSGELRQDDEFFDNMQFGVRVPLGLDLNFREAPVQVSGDVAAAIPFIPEPELGLDIFLSVRYYF